MSRGGKVALIVIGVMLLVLCGLCTATYFWIDANKDRLREAAEGLHQSGSDFASGKDVNDCVEESLGRVDACGELALKCPLKVQLFLEGCLHHAAPVTGFCDGVPAPLEVIALVSWQSDECERRGRPGDEGCINLLNAVSGHCHPE